MESSNTLLDTYREYLEAQRNYEGLGRGPPMEQQASARIPAAKQPSGPMALFRFELQPGHAEALLGIIAATSYDPCLEDGRGVAVWLPASIGWRLTRLLAEPDWSAIRTALRGYDLDA